MADINDRAWTCPECRRTTVITASDHDTRAAIEAVRDRHRRMHAAATMPRRLGAR